MSSAYSAGASSPAREAVAVTPSDATVLPVTRGLYVGTGGNLAVRMAGRAGQDGPTITFTNVVAGFIPLQVDMVLSTGTVASGIIALY
jgi:hypothetical protein